MFQATLIEAPDAVWEKLGIDTKQFDESRQPDTIFNAQAAEAFLKAVQENPEAQITSRPRITTSDGAEASLNQSDDESSLNLTTNFHMSPDHKSLDLDLVATLTRRGPALSGK